MLRYPIFQQSLVTSAAQTASGDSGLIEIGTLDFEKITIVIPVTAASGTTPTLDIYIQQSLDGGTTFTDMAHLPQVTAAVTNPYHVSLAHGGGSVISAGVGDATIAANTIGGGIISRFIKVKWVIGGTTPSFTFAATLYAA